MTPDHRLGWALAAGDEAFALLDALWESSPVGYAYFDTRLRYRRVNGAVLAIDGGTADSRIGRTVEEVHGRTGADIAAVMRRVLDDGRPHLDVALRGRLWHGAGALQEWRINAYPVRVRGQEEISGVGLVVTDVTAAAASRRELDRIAVERERALVRYQSLVEAADSAVWVREVDGSAERDSPRLRAVTGQSFAEMRGWGHLTAVHPDHRAGWWAAWERAAAGGDVFTHTHRLRTATGEHRWFRTRAVPVRESSRVVEWVGTETDVDDEVRARVRLDVLAGATLAVNSPAEAAGGDALAALAAAVVPDFADICRVYLLDPVRATGPVTGTRGATSTAAGVAEPVTSGRFVFGPGHPVHQAVRAGIPVLADVTAARPEDWTPSDAQVRWGLELQSHSLIACPVSAGGVPVAAMVFIGCGDRPHYADEDRTLVAEVAQRASVAVERAGELERNRRVAVTLQSAMLTDPHSPPGMEIVGSYLPASSGLAVGGDWYDAFPLADGELAVGVGDVAGHDLPAATAMGQLRSMLRALADCERPPSAAVTALDRVASRLGVTAFTSLVHGVVRRGTDGAATFQWSNAGHPAPVLVAPGAPARFLHGEGRVDVVLGVAPDSPRTDHTVDLVPGSTLLLYTDGLIERRDDPDDEATADLLAHVDAHAGLPLPVFCEHLVRTSTSDTDDDIAVLAVRLV